MKTSIEERADEVWLNEEFDCVGVESDGFSGGKVSDMLLKFRESEIKLDREERAKKIDDMIKEINLAKKRYGTVDECDSGEETFVCEERHRLSDGFIDSLKALKGE